MQVYRASCLAFLAVLISFTPSCKSRKASNLSRKYGPAELKRDATLFRDVTMAMHPVVGVYQPRAYYLDLFNNYIEGIRDSLTEKKFRLELKLIAAELNCGHTEVIASKGTIKELRRQKLNFSPYLFMPLNNKLYMVASAGKKQDSLLEKGIEITKINGISADSMIRHSRRFMTTDGFNQSGRDHFIQWNFNSYYLALFGRPDTFVVEYRSKNGLRNIRYESVKLNNLPPVSFAPKADSTSLRYKIAGMRHTFLDKENKTLLLKIEKFSHRKYRKAYRKIFRKLERNHCDNLIIDLRNNGGGSIANAYRLLGYLMDTSAKQTLNTRIRHYPFRKYTSGNIWFRLTRTAFKIFGTKVSVKDTDYYTYTIRPAKKNRFNGKVLVLINGGSFSASCMVAAYLKYRNRALFIGDETGGAQEGCNAGITPYYRLPNTGIRARIPAFRVNNDVYSKLTGRGIVPDIPIQYQISDILKRRDLEVEKAKDLLKIR